MLMQRIRTGLALAVPAVLLILFAPPWMTDAVIGVLILAAAWEWAALAGLQGSAARRTFVLCVALTMGLAVHLAGPGRPGLQPLLLASGVGWALAAVAVIAYPRGTTIWGSIPARVFLGLCVLVPPGVAVLYLRSLTHGEWLLLFCIALIAFVDMGAFFSGRAFGGPKLMPRVSPAKTWSGFCGGVLASLALAVIAGLGAGMEGESLQPWLWVCLLTALAAVVGDLLESMLKRFTGIKDSGSLLPGHGGLFDRLDSLTAGLPLFALGTFTAGGFVT
jgi:phosphatidate cytidylyltransferase